MQDIEIIEDTVDARELYGHRYGSNHLVLETEHIEALQQGKCVACNDGEYTLFVTLNKK